MGGCVIIDFGHMINLQEWRSQWTTGRWIREYA